MEENKIDKDGLPSNITPAPSYEAKLPELTPIDVKPSPEPTPESTPEVEPEADWRSDLAFKQARYQKQIKSTVDTGIGSNLDYDKMRNKLGDDFQLHKGEKYLVGEYDKKIKAEQKAYQVKLADEQGFLGEAYGFAWQAASEIVYGAIEGAGYLMDWESFFTEGEEDDWNNAVSNWAAEMNEGVAKNAPIHLNPDSKGRFAYEDSAWWFSNGVSLASAVSIMIPVAGWAKGVGLVGKGAKLLSNAAKAGKYGKLAAKVVAKAPKVGAAGTKTASAVHKGIVSRHIESSMEANGVFKEKYDEYIDQGMSEAEAKRNAADGAAFSYRANWAMALQDIGQYIMLGRGMSPAKAIGSFKLARATGNSIVKSAAMGGKNAASQFISEGFEESYQFVVGEEAKLVADIHAGLVDPDDTTLAERMKGYTRDSEMWTAAFFGGLGGMAMQGAGSLSQTKMAQKLKNKVATKLGHASGVTDFSNDVDRRIKEHLTRNEVIAANLDALNTAVQAEDERGTNAAKVQIEFDAGYNSSEVGNLELAIQNMEDLKDATPEEMAEHGFDEDFKANIDKHIAGMRRVGELFQKNSKKYAPATVKPITQLQFLVEKYEARTHEVNKQIADLTAKMPNVNKLSDHGQVAFDYRVQTLSTDRWIRSAEWKMENGKMTPTAKEKLAVAVENKKAVNESSKKAFAELEAATLTTEDKIALEAVNGTYAEDLSVAKSELDWLQHYQGTYLQEINHMTSVAGQAFLEEQIATNKKESKKKKDTAKKKDEQSLNEEKLNDGLSSQEKEQVIDEATKNLTSDESMQALETSIALSETTLEEQTPEVQKALAAYKAKRLQGKTPESRDENKDHQGTKNAAVNHVELETPPNDNGNIDGEDEGAIDLYITTQITPLAWLSVNNKEMMTDAADTPENKALTTFLEYNFSLTGVDIEFTVHNKFIDAQAAAGSQEYKDIQTALASGVIPEELVGKIPIVGALKRNGVPVTHNDIDLTLSIHDDSFFLDTKDAKLQAAQMAQVIQDKRTILEAHFKGQKVATTFVGKTGGTLNHTKDSNGNFTKNTISIETGRTASSIQYMYGDSTDSYFNNDGEQNGDLAHLKSATPGAIYTLVKKANGEVFPLRAHVDNLAMSEAKIIHSLYVQILTDSKILKQGLNDATIEAITKDEDPRVSDLAKFLPLNTMTYAELLNHLVFEGKAVTSSKKSSRLYIEAATTKKGKKNTAVLVYGDKKIDLKRLSSPKGADLVINHLIENRRRQVDVQRLGDKAYKEYLDANGVLYTNAKATPEGNLFIQPVPIYNANLQVVKSAVSKASTTEVKEGSIVTPVSTDVVVEGPIVNTQEEALSKIAAIQADAKDFAVVDAVIDGKKVSTYQGKGLMLERQSSLVKRLNKEKEDSNDNMTQGAVVGNFVDIIGRDVFDPNIQPKTLSEYKAEADAMNKSNNSYLLNTTEKEFKYLIDTFTAIKGELLDQGMSIISNDFFIYKRYTKEERKRTGFDGVGGTLDLAAIDKKGELHIIDFKNIKLNAKNQQYTASNIYGPSKFDTKTKKWADQQSTYGYITETAYGIKVASTNILALSTTYSKEGKVITLEESILTNDFVDIDEGFESPMSDTLIKLEHSSIVNKVSPLTMENAPVETPPAYDAKKYISEASSIRELDAVVDQMTANNVNFMTFLRQVAEKRAELSIVPSKDTPEIQVIKEAIIADISTQVNLTEEEDNDLDDFLDGEVEGESAFKSYTPSAAVSHTPNKPGHEAEIAHINTLLPAEIATKLVTDYIGLLSDGKVIAGLFQNGMITISEKAEMGTAYHEAFHAVFRTLLNQEQRTSLIGEAIKSYAKPTESIIATIMEDVGIEKPEAIVVYYEERLADDFMGYMANPTYASRHYSYSPGIKGLFQKLMDWITGVFSNKTTARKLFSDISRSKYATKKPSITRSIAFSAKHPTYSAQEVRDTTKQMAYLAFKNVKSLDTIDKYDANNIINELKRTYKSTKSLLLADPTDAAAKEKLGRIKALFTKEMTLAPFWENNIKAYIKEEFDLKLVKKIDNKEDAVETDEGILSFLKSSYESSGKDTATKMVKFLVAMTPDIKGYKDGEPIYNRDTLLGLPRFNDFSVTYNSLETLLADKIAVVKDGEMEDGYQVMVNAMKAEFTYKPELQHLIGRLEQMPEYIKTQFFFTFSRTRGKYTNHLVEGRPGNITSKIGESDINSKESTIRGTWAAEFASRVGIEVEGKTVYDSIALENIAKQKTILLDAIDEGMKLQSMTDDVLRAFGDTLTALGVTMSEKGILKLLFSQNMIVNPLKPTLHQLKAFNVLTNKLMKATSNLPKLAGKPLTNKTNLLLDEDKFFKNTLARAEGEFRKVSGESSFLGPDGNQIWAYQDNNSFSKLVAEFKAGDLSHLQDLQSSLWGRNSVWLRELLDETHGVKNRANFSLDLYGNFKEEGRGDKGDKASNLKFSDTYMDQFNKQLKGLYIGLAEADKGQQGYFKGPKLRRSMVTFNEETKSLEFTNSNPAAISILAGYLADELHRMDVAKKTIYGQPATEHDAAIPPLADEKQQIYYHYYPVEPGKGQFGKDMDRIEGNAFKSFLFPDLLDAVTDEVNKETGETLLQELGLMDASGNIVPLSREVMDDNPAVKDYLRTTFLTLVEQDIRTAVETGLVTEQGNKLTNRVIDKTEIEDRDGNIHNAIADYTLNSLIGNIEQTKIFNGDPALFKVKAKDPKWSNNDLFADFRKRVPSTSASGKDARIYKNSQGNWAVRPYYTSATIANIDGITSEFFGNSETGEFNKVNLARVEKATGVKVAELEQLFKPYLDVNVTDAQAWITLDVYKERMNSWGKWTPAHEDAKDAMEKGVSTPKQVKLLAMPLKTVHNELVKSSNDVMALHYNKQSEAVLLPILTQGTALDKLRLAMEKGGLEGGGPDHVIVLDGKKAGGVGITDISDGNGNLLVNPTFNTTQLSYKRLFLQQDLSSKGTKPTVVGSQTVKNVLAVIEPTGQYGDLKGEQLLEAYHNVISELSNLGLKSFQDKIGYTKNGRDDVKLRALLATEFAGEISDNHINAIISGVNLDSLPISKKIQNKLHSMLTKEAVKLKQLGGAMVQLSDFGFTGVEVDMDSTVKDGIVWLKDPSEKLQPMRIDEEGVVHPAQILMPHSFLMKELKAAGYNIKGKTHTEIRKMIPKSVLEGLSYRIPNNLSSNDAFEIVGILPEEAGDTMVAFSAITTKTGSDFDIDKSFVILPNFGVDKKTGEVFYRKDDGKEGLENKRLEMMREMLLHPSAYTTVMAPLDDPWLSDLASEIYPDKNDLRSLQFFTGNNQMKTKAVFDAAKSLVGTVANHNSHYALALAENLSFNKYYLGKGMKVTANAEVTKVDATGKRETDFVAANDTQTTVIDEISQFLAQFKKGVGSNVHVLSGKAGTGKTTVVAEIIAQLPTKYAKVGVTAISNKATKNLFAKVEHIEGTTSGSVAKMLGMKRDNETGEFTIDKYNQYDAPARSMDVIFVDEASMLNEQGVDLLNSLGIPIIYIGDKGQLPPIRKEGDPNDGKDSPIFDKEDSKLFERVRQGEKSPILPFADHFWKNSRVENPVLNPGTERKSVVTDEGSLIFGGKDLVQHALPLYKKGIETNNPNLVKTVVYRNATRQNVNEFVRKNILEDSSIPFQPKELLMFNNSWVIDEDLQYDNSDEVQIINSVPGTSPEGFDMYYITLAEATIPVIAPSSKKAFEQQVRALFNKAYTFPVNSPQRKSAFAAAWELDGRYADIDYSYAITSHKSQGSTYNTVIVYEGDIMSITKADNKAKSQSMYTAITRAAETTLVLDGTQTDSTLIKEAIDNSLEVAGKTTKVNKPKKIVRNAKPVAQNSPTSQLSNKLDEDGREIAGTLLAFMNAIVDAAKDPYITRANINQFTANTAFMLVRAGISREWIVSFMGQPIIKDLVALTAAAEGRFAEKKRNAAGIEISPLDQVLKKYGYTKGPGEIYSENMKGTDGEIRMSTKGLQSYLEYDAEYNKTQIDILGQFLEWQSKAKSLNELVKISKSDTDGATKNQATARLRENLLNKIIHDNAIVNADKLLGYDVVGGNAEFNGSRFTGTYYENSIRAAREMFAGMFISNSPAVEATSDLMASLAGIVHLVPTTENETLLNDLANEFYALTATDTSTFRLDGEAKPKADGSPSSYSDSQVGLHALLFGNSTTESLVTRLSTAKKGVENENLLIQALEVRPGNKNTPGAIFLPKSESLKEAKDDLYLAWEELQSTNKELAEDLMKYSFYASGMSKAIGSFYEHIPMDFLAEKNYSDQINHKISEYSNPNALVRKIDSVYKHMSENDKLVPVITDKVFKPMKVKDELISIPTSDAFIVTPLEGANYIAGLDVKGDYVFKRFVKRKFKSADEYNNITTTIVLYQQMGLTPKGNAVYMRTNKLGYSKNGVIFKEYNGKNNNASIFKENRSVPLHVSVMPYANNTVPNQIPVSEFDATKMVIKKTDLTEEEAVESLNFCIDV